MSDAYYDIPTVIRRRNDPTHPNGTASTTQRARLLDPDWVYVPAAETNVQKTWRKFGWTPRYPRVETTYD